MKIKYLLSYNIVLDATESKGRMKDTLEQTLKI